jgi:hypothetical protein
MLMDQKLPHSTNHFFLSLDKAVVVRVCEHDDSAVGNLFAKPFDLLLLKLPHSAQSIFRLCSCRVGQGLNKIGHLKAEPNHRNTEGWRPDFSIVRI